jgi:bromodomain-containing protein 8
MINTTTEFERDVVLMLNNSLMYNKEGTEVYQLAREMLDDVMEQIRIFRTADMDTSASSHTRAASMAAKADRRKSTVPE